jgi:hypothetical protein
MLNDFAAAEQGKSLIVKKKKEIVDSISTSIPYMIKAFSTQRLERNLGFEPIDLGDVYVPSYVF